MTKEKKHIEDESKFRALKVNEGTTSPVSINPSFSEKYTISRKKTIDANTLFKGIQNQNRAILSRAITLVESTHHDDQKNARSIVKKCLPLSGKSFRIGITGVPGAGKSTFIESFGNFLIEKGQKVAVLAIDPSSSISKGSILGDKTRMKKLAANQNAFVRPSPSAGTLGGVAQKTRESIFLCEAAGFDTIIVETVGVGQSEIAVNSLVDTFVLIQIAGAGDELQGIKKGIMEMSDIVLINKADGKNLSKAQLAKSQIEAALHLFPPAKSGWAPTVLTCSAKEKIGLEDVWDMLTDYYNQMKQGGYFEQCRIEQAKYWMHETINSQLKSNFLENEEMNRHIEKYEKAVLNKEMTSFTAAKKLLEIYFNNLKT